MDGQIKAQKNYDDFLNGFYWDTTIGATEGRIYKIALQTMGMDKDKINYIFKKTLIALAPQM